MPEFPFQRLSKDEVFVLLHELENNREYREGLPHKKLVIKRHEKFYNALDEIELGESIVILDEELTRKKTSNLVRSFKKHYKSDKSYEVLPYDKGKTIRVQRTLKNMYGQKDETRNTENLQRTSGKANK